MKDLAEKFVMWSVTESYRWPSAGLNPSKGFCCYACEQTLKHSSQEKKKNPNTTASIFLCYTLWLALEIRNSFQSVCQKRRL